MTANIRNKRSGTAAEWTGVSDRVLGDGEVGVETDTGKQKVGDGRTSWAALPYDPGTSGTSGPTGYFAIEGDYNAHVTTVAGEQTPVPLSQFNVPLADIGGIAHLVDYGTAVGNPPTPNDQAALVFDKPGKFFVRLVGEVSQGTAGQTYQRLYLDQADTDPLQGNDQMNEIPFASRPYPETWIADGAICYVEEEGHGAIVGIPIRLQCQIGGHDAAWDWFGIWIDQLA